MALFIETINGYIAKVLYTEPEGYKIKEYMPIPDQDRDLAQIIGTSTNFIYNSEVRQTWVEDD